MKLGVEETPTKDSKVLVYPPGSQAFIRFEGTHTLFRISSISNDAFAPVGTLKYKPLNRYLGTVADGTAEFPMQQERAEGPSVTPEVPPSSKVGHGDTTRSESASSSIVASASSVPSPHVDQTGETEAAPDRREADTTISVANDVSSFESLSVPEATASTNTVAEEGVRSDHTRDEL